MRLLMDFVFTGRTWGIFGRAGMVIGTTVSADFVQQSAPGYDDLPRTLVITLRGSCMIDILDGPFGTTNRGRDR